jgi:hypothetical protein
MDIEEFENIKNDFGIHVCNICMNENIKINLK